MSSSTWGWIIAIAVVAFLLRYVKFSVTDKNAPPEKRAPLPAAPELPEDTDEYHIVGTSKYQRELSRLMGPKGEHGVDETCGAVLTPEPKNPYDKNAVRCEISGVHVGYLSRDDAKDFAKYFRRKKLSSITVAATIRGGWKNSKGEGNFGVAIEVPADSVP